MRFGNIFERINKLWESLLTVGKIILLSKKAKLIPINQKDIAGNKCIIIGNGPSLKEELLENFQFFKTTTSICVNYFPVSDAYIRLQPNAIVLHAPEFWIDDVKDEYKVIRQKIFDAIKEKTTWNFIVYAPIKARKSKIVIEKLLENKHIRLSFYNDTPIEGMQSINTIFFNQGLGLPRPHNVVIPALIVAIRQSFKEIYLTGVDHSWLKEISVDENNNVLVGQYHFYDNDSIKPEPMNKVGRLKTRNLAEVLEKFIFTFKSYYIINEYAKAKNVKIFNATKGSFIDAFERIDFKSLI